MKIEFIGEVAVSEAPFLAACQRIYRWGASDIDVKVHMHPREPNGWLEWLIVIRDEHGDHRITIGMIQREPGKEFEFHS
jgi:hypothetical protein